MISFNMPVVLSILCSLACFLFIPPKHRWILLLFLSVALISTQGLLGISVTLAQAVAAFIMGIWLQRRTGAARVWICVILQLLPMLMVKSQGFLGTWPWGAPIGLSYYTFQIVSYLLDVHWRKRSAERNLGQFILYVILFINKVTGPIERSSLIEQFRTIYAVSSEAMFRAGLFIWIGFVQKFVLADHLASYVEPVFNSPDQYHGLPVVFAILLSKYQIFCDFSGGSMIAFGLGGLFGLRLTLNFDRPFAATSLREFWRRWHISLQTWIRDYVFYPLLSTSVAKFGLFYLLAITYLVFSLWHGFRWTLVAYGLIQAFLLWLAPERFFTKLKSAKIGLIPLGTVSILLFNYTILISLPSVLFRSQTLAQSGAIWGNMGFDRAHLEKFMSLGELRLPFILLLIAAHEGLLWFESTRQLTARLSRLHWTFKSGLAFMLVVILFFLAKLDSPGRFIYGQF